MATARNLLDDFRRDPRASPAALLVREDGVQEPVTVTEFTSNGFRLAVSVRPNLGELVHLRVEGAADVPAKIRWAHGSEAGGSH